MIQKQILKICDLFFKNKQDIRLGKLTIIISNNEYYFYHYHMLVLKYDFNLDVITFEDSECRTDTIIKNNFKLYLKTFIMNSN